MNKWISEGLNLMISIPLGIVAWGISLFSLELGWLPSLLLMVAVPVTFYSGVKGVLLYSFLKKHEISYKDYKYIDHQINLAEKKVKKLNVDLLKMKHLSSIKLRLEFIQVTRKIISEVKKDPKKFYQAENFFYHYLDSAVELASRYNLLLKHPSKSFDYEDTLHTTKKTLFDLKPLMEDELNSVLNNSMEHLQLEIDIAKLAIDNHKDWKDKKDG